MAGSKDKEKDNSADEFADDLDAMLNDAESSMEGTDDESVDDDDVIDRLLMDDSFDPTEEDDNVSGEQDYSNIDKSNTDNMAEKQENNDIDEFAGEIDEFADEDEFDVDSLLSEAAEDLVVGEENDESTDTEASNSINNGEEENETPVEEKPEESEEEFDIDALIDSTSASNDNELKAESESAEDDFLMADFDISADGVDELLESNEADELEEEIVEPSVESSVEPNEQTNNNEPRVDFKSEIEAQQVVITKATEDLVSTNKTLSELSGQINQVIAENETLKGLVAELTTVTTEKNDAAVEEIDGLQKDQRKLKRTVKEVETKVPVIVYVVMGIAILALFVGGGLGAIGYGAKTDVDNLAEQVSSIEEEIEIITTKDFTSDIREIKFNINELKIKGEGVDEQLLGLLKEMQKPKPNTLQPVVDDLTVQNNHAQKAIEKLLAAVEILEQNEVVTAAARKKAMRARKALAKVTWVVNLVSFKQEWYAKRKAEEFNKKGVSAKVEKVKVNGEKWFRLQVKGFKTKYEAAAYAVKVKKILNLNSVWVTKI